MKNLLIVFGISLFLAGCSFEDVFSMLATSDVEQAAGEVMEKQKAQQHKLDVIEAKKSAFPEHLVLAQVEEESSFQAVVFRNRYEIDDKSIIDIEAMMPDPGEKKYLVWVKSDEEKTYNNIGSLEYKSENDYIFVYEVDDDLTEKRSVVISLDAADVDQPEKPILSGVFVTK